MMSWFVLITLLALQPVYTGTACPTANCEQCIGNSGCVSCNDGFWLGSGECIQCPLLCSRCTHSLQCQSCVASYWNPGLVCDNLCPANCTESGCEDTTGYCYECKPGKYGQECNQDCSLCKNGECDLRKCTDGCKDGYVRYSSIKGQSDCFPCSTNCIKCFNSSYCTQCEQGFYKHYYRNSINGRGITYCKVCWEPCTQCISDDQCPEECKLECIKQGCAVLGGCATTNSETTTNTKSTTSLRTEQITQSTAKNEVCPNECKEVCDVDEKDTTTKCSKSDDLTCMCTEKDTYYEGFRPGIATGIGITIVVGALIGVVLFFVRRKKCHQTICCTKSSAEHHVYVNTQKETGTRPAMTNKPEYNVASLNTGVRVTMSEQEVDADKEYISLGDRQPEHHYSDLQTN